MMHFEGTESVAPEPGLAFARLADAGWVARLLPDGELVTVSADQAAWKARPKFAFMGGSLDTVATVSYRTADRSVRYRIVSTGIGSRSAMEATLSVRPREGSGSVVHWTGELLELGGLLARVPRAMIQAAALRTIADIWAALRPALAEPGEVIPVAPLSGRILGPPTPG